MPRKSTTHPAFGISIGLAALGLQKPRLLKCRLALFDFVIESYCKSITPLFVHIKGSERRAPQVFFQMDYFRNFRG